MLDRASALRFTEELANCAEGCPVATSEFGLTGRRCKHR
jgi:hypothetical protein